MTEWDVLRPIRHSHQIVGELWWEKSEIRQVIMDELFEEQKLLEPRTKYTNCTFRKGLRWPAGQEGRFIIVDDSLITNPNSSGCAPSKLMLTPGCSDIIIRDCTIVDCGNVNADYDQDYHGVAPGHTRRLLVEGCNISKCSGNGVQMSHNPRDPIIQSDIAVVGCYIHGNKQAGVSLKRVIRGFVIANMIEDCFPHGENPSDHGFCIVCQYHHDAIIAYNDMSRAQYGIRVGDSDCNLLILGNAFANFGVAPGYEHLDDPRFPQRPGSCIHIRGGQKIAIVKNVGVHCNRFLSLEQGFSTINRRVEIVGNGALEYLERAMFVNSANDLYACTGNFFVPIGKDFVDGYYDEVDGLAGWSPVDLRRVPLGLSNIRNRTSSIIEWHGHEDFVLKTVRDCLNQKETRDGV